jgi:hypothetical protein
MAESLSDTDLKHCVPIPLLNPQRIYFVVFTLYFEQNLLIKAYVNHYLVSLSRLVIPIVKR